MAPREAEEAAVRERFPQIAEVDRPHRVTLAREGEDRVRPALDAAADPPREVNPKKGNAGSGTG